MKIHISEVTAELLQGTDFIVEERGKVEVKVCTSLHCPSNWSVVGRLCTADSVASCTVSEMFHRQSLARHLILYPCSETAKLYESSQRIAHSKLEWE